ncbi:MAG: hypothetical protein K8J08_09620 [Thermoanaerobaculia bacterium]|nr:hypothetical protein [Thermoanaerobaculia bacterium]
MVLIFHGILAALVWSLFVRVAPSLRPEGSERRRLSVELVKVLLVALMVAWLLSEVVAHSRFALMRLLGILGFVYVPLVVLGISVRTWRRGRRWSSGVAIAVSLALVAVGIDAYWIEPQRLEVSRVELRSSKVDRVIRIVVVADLQTDAIGDYERGALRTVMEQKPDLIVLPGDYLQIRDPERRRVLAGDLRKALKDVQLGAPLGAFAIRGDMESRDWSESFAGTGVVTLEDHTILALDGLDLTALTPQESHRVDLRVAGRDPFHLVFGHAPDFALGDVQADLLVAGHTHGGQVRLPFIGPLLTFSHVPRDWAAGVTELSGGRTLVVSRGVGMERGEAPRIRFLCRPEIVVIDVLPAG